MGARRKARELALQISSELERLSKRRNVSVVAIYGGAPMPRQVDEELGRALRRETSAQAQHEPARLRTRDRRGPRRAPADRTELPLREHLSPPLRERVLGAAAGEEQAECEPAEHRDAERRQEKPSLGNDAHRAKPHFAHKLAGAQLLHEFVTG